MGTKKDIGKILKERLNELDDSPRNSVWENIESELNKKKKDRIILPIWLRYSVIAIVLLSLGIVLNSAFKTERDLFNPTNIEKQKSNQNSTKSSENKSIDDNQINNTINTNNKSKIPNIRYTTKDKSPSKSSRNNYLVSQSNLAKKSESNLFTISNDKPLQKAKVIKNLKTEIDSLTVNRNQTDSIKDTIIEVKKEKKQHLAENKEQDSVIKSIKHKTPWNITVSFIPTYYGTISKGSSLDADLKNNTKTEHFTFNYGLFFNYNIDDNFSMRTGISKTTLNYTTKDISTIDGNGNTISIYNISAISPDNNALISGKIDTFLNNNEKINLTQTVDYIEIPLEVVYKLGKNKISFNTITGFSYLILSGNTIEGFSKNTENFKIGIANNLNQMNFSVNLGGGIRYRINNRMNLNLNSVFKYQLITYEKNYGSFKSFSIGLQTGVNYEF